MTANHSRPNLLTGEFSISSYVMAPGAGWGYDIAVDFEPQMADEPVGQRHFLVAGSGRHWFWRSTNDVVFVGMTQRMNPGRPDVIAPSRARSTRRW